jgi:HK97 family phage portal protein
MNWIETRIGGSNRHKPLVVDRGAKFTPISMSGADAQTIENRRFQIEEICRAFRVMPIMIGQADKAATYASAEQMFLAHVTYTLTPWVSRLEQSIDCNLLTEDEISQGYYSKFNLSGLMRGAAKDRAEFYDKMYRMKVLNPNEIRGLEEMNSYSGGEQYYIEPGSQLLNDQTSE